MEQTKGQGSTWAIMLIVAAVAVGAVLLATGIQLLLIGKTINVVTIAVAVIVTSSTGYFLWQRSK
ncbi:MAG: hypothetical protein AB7P14_21750 [Blastocatellales bacterium]